MLSRFTETKLLKPNETEKKSSNYASKHDKVKRQPELFQGRDVSVIFISD